MKFGLETLYLPFWIRTKVGGCLGTEVVAVSRAGLAFDPFLGSSLKNDCETKFITLEEKDRNWDEMIKDLLKVTNGVRAG